MKKLRAYSGLIFVLGIFAINAFLWFTAEPLVEQPIESIIVQWQGSNILLGFTLVFFLATKNRIVVTVFDGLERDMLIYPISLFKTLFPDCRLILERWAP